MKKATLFLQKNWKLVVLTLLGLIVIYWAYRQFFGTPLFGRGSDMGADLGTGSTSSLATRTSTKSVGTCITKYNNSPAPFPLREGSRGSNVKALQRYLNSKGNNLV